MPSQKIMFLTHGDDDGEYAPIYIYQYNTAVAVKKIYYIMEKKNNSYFWPLVK